MFPAAVHFILGVCTVSYTHLLSLLMVFALAACSAEPTGETDPATSADPSTAEPAASSDPAAQATAALDEVAEVTEGGTLKIGVNTEIVHTMLSFTLTGAGMDYYASWPVYESLFRPNEEGSVAVSYTHLDVYKRQVPSGRCHDRSF